MVGASSAAMMKIIEVMNSSSKVTKVKSTTDANTTPPESILRRKDILGRVPLHYACKHPHLREVIQELIILDPESSKVADVNGFLPIHVACRFGQAVGVIRLLLADFPSLVAAKTKKGSTPKMLAEKYMEDGTERKRQVVAMLQQKEYKDKCLQQKGFRR